MDVLSLKPISFDIPSGKDLLSLHVRVKFWHPTPLNKLLTPNVSYRNQLKKRDYAIVKNAVKGLPKAKSRRIIFFRINLTKGQRACDVDAYNKCLLDALVESKMLINDSYNHVILLPVEFSRGKLKSTDIYLYEAIDDEHQESN